MLSKIQKPKIKQELINSLQFASIQSIAAYEGLDVNLLQSKPDLIRQTVSVIIMR